MVKVAPLLPPPHIGSDQCTLQCRDHLSGGLSSLHPHSFSLLIRESPLKLDECDALTNLKGSAGQTGATSGQCMVGCPSALWILGLASSSIDGTQAASVEVSLQQARIFSLRM